MMERKNGMRLPAVVLLAALAFSCFAPAALATAEEPPEDLPAAVSAQDGARSFPYAAEQGTVLCKVKMFLFALQFRAHLF